MIFSTISINRLELEVSEKGQSFGTNTNRTCPKTTRIIKPTFA
jgi:hypothetical protein